MIEDLSVFNRSSMGKRLQVNVSAAVAGVPSPRERGNQDDEEDEEQDENANAAPAAARILAGIRAGVARLVAVATKAGTTLGGPSPSDENDKDQDDQKDEKRSTTHVYEPTKKIQTKIFVLLALGHRFERNNRDCRGKPGCKICVVTNG